MISVEMLEAAYENLPVLEDEVILEPTRKRIEIVKKSAEKAGILHTQEYRGFHLISTESPYVFIYKDGKRIGKVENERVQALQLQAMKEFGLNEDVYKERGSHFPEPEYKNKNGGSTQYRLFPSSTTPYLAFERKTTHDSSYRILSIHWMAVDTAPMLRLGKKITLDRQITF